MFEPEGTASSATFDINTFAVKLPEFWADSAGVYFAQTVAQFAVQGVTSSLTKFYYCGGPSTKLTPPRL